MPKKPPRLVPWSPAAYLKSNNDVSGGPNGTGTLKKDIYGNYVYADYAFIVHSSLPAVFSAARQTHHWRPEILNALTPPKANKAVL